MLITSILAALIIGYLLGSIPFGFLTARAYGVNILKEGSGNPGATNVKRVVGPMAGNIVFFLDFLKGFVPVFLPLWWFGTEAGLLPAAFGLAGAILGHGYSVFLNFRGGKGVATTMGGLVALMPEVVILGLVVWVVVFYVSRYVSLASLCFAISLPFSNLFLGKPSEMVLLSLLITGFIFYRHRDNIRRLREGTENRFSRRVKSEFNPKE